jgi:hypothetical protein
MELRLHFYKDDPDDPVGLLPTEEDDPDAIMFKFEYVTFGSSRYNSWSTSETILKNERGQWAVSPSALRSLADYMFRRGREHQASLIKEAVNYSAMK